MNNDSHETSQISRYKDSIWCCIITSLSHPWGLGGALVCTLHSKSVTRTGPATVWQNKSNWCLQLWQPFSPLGTTVMWHVIAWKRVETREGKSTGLIYTKRWSLCQGRLESGIYNPEIAAFLIHREFSCQSFRITSQRNNNKTPLSTDTLYSIRH